MLFWMRSYGRSERRIEDGIAETALSDNQKQIEEKAALSARKYIEGIPEGIVFLDEKDPSVKDDLKDWEERIFSYARDHGIELRDTGKVHTLANRTTSLIKLLKEASMREKEGLDPYTGMSGFNTMTLVMTIEKEFEEQLGFSFADFFASQDPEKIKSMVN